jgi:hypothetical protein
MHGYVAKSDTGACRGPCAVGNEPVGASLGPRDDSDGLLYPGEGR